MINLAILPLRLTLVELNGSRNSFLYEFVEKVLIFCSRRSLKERQCFVMIAQLNFNIGTISVFFNNIYCLSLYLSVQMQMEKIHPNPTFQPSFLWICGLFNNDDQITLLLLHLLQIDSQNPRVIPSITLTCLVAVWLWTQEEKRP